MALCTGSPGSPAPTPHGSRLAQEIMPVTSNARVLIKIGDVVFQNQAHFSSGLIANVTAAMRS